MKLNPEFLIQLKEFLKNNSNLLNNRIELRKEYNKSFPTLYKMVIVVRKDLKMSTGKVAAQVGHGVLKAYKKSLKENPKFVNDWEIIGSSAKVVLEVNSLKEIEELSEKAEKLKISYDVICDCGKTEVDPYTITVIALGPGPVELLDKVTGHLKRYKD